MLRLGSKTASRLRGSTKTCIEGEGGKIGVRAHVWGLAEDGRSEGCRAVGGVGAGARAKAPGTHLYAGRDPQCEILPHTRRRPSLTPGGRRRRRGRRGVRGARSPVAHRRPVARASAEHPRAWPHRWLIGVGGVTRKALCSAICATSLEVRPRWPAERSTSPPPPARRMPAPPGPPRSVAEEPALTAHDNSLSRALYCLKSSAMWAWAVGFSGGALAYGVVMAAEHRQLISRKRGTRLGVRTVVKPRPTAPACIRHPQFPAPPVSTGCRGHSSAHVIGRDTHRSGQSARRARDEGHWRTGQASIAGL